MRQPIDAGSDLDRASLLDGLMRSPAWRLVVDHLSERVDAAMERIVQIDCTDRERAELAGEVRGLRHAIEWPGEEATFILNSLAEKK